MTHMHRLFTLVMVAVLALLAIPATLAQTTESAPMTISVTGTGSATTDPDMATIEIGVEMPDTDVASAYNQVNETISTIMDALNDLGIVRDDMSTSGLNIYSEGGIYDGQSQNRFRVSNRLRVTVRDLDLIESVIDTAVSNGANNIFGLQFGISDPQTLQSEARTDALDDARERAQEIADNIGVTLGDVVAVTELQGGGFPFSASEMAMGGGNSAVIEPGALAVQIQVNVTFEFSR